MPPTVHLVRHAEGFHNLSVENESMRDPDLTPLGEQQCADLRSAFPSHARLTALVASPLRRTIKTCDLAFGGHDKLYPIVLLDTLQEVSDAPCDTGSSKDALRAEFGDKIDLQRVRGSWTQKGDGSPFEPTMEALMARAKSARRALREIAGDADGEVAVVSHGGFLHFLTDDWDGVPIDSATAWSNCMCRSYQFAGSPDDDGDVRLVETKESWKRRQPASRQPLTATEQREIRAVVQKRLVPHLNIKA
ncbi:phosphoglycerate mutase family protein [Metarhizium album ARSEF 1941]|uniref:Phosphoglycerate mutase family protein n=1 Tax=Metarhizium album (strain ARSEF 1941) TaxID=1081103 RepID=A0A0B2X7U5_METAS|nr:phosphoglycerate mutase family protein [Metarhizium album ARSEF 1941]KHO01813.1 phosphoglycerate mutase family protein [Metarhizium album ARSEF 1941]